MMLRNATHSCRGAMPPLLIQQESLRDEIKRPAFPTRSGKAFVLRQRIDATLWWVEVGRVESVNVAAPKFLPCLLHQLFLFRRRELKMRQPVEVSIGQCSRRDVSRKSAEMRIE